MPKRTIMCLGGIAALMFLVGISTALAGESSRTLQFSGYTWAVRASGFGGPGPNYWAQTNVWVDTDGYLHLRLTQRDGRWYCAEVSTRERLGFGSYQFRVAGRIDRLDPNVVLGLFNYPTSDVGRDGTHEIDIEFAKWGNSSAPIGNYTVWPAATNATRQSKVFPFVLKGDLSTHQFVWSSTNVFYQSFHDRDDGDRQQFADWLYQPRDPLAQISRQPMPVHMNLWCFKGKPPADGQPVEVVIRAFKFTPF